MDAQPQQSMTVSTPVEVQIGSNPIKDSKPPEISLDPKDFQQEIQKIAKEQGMEIKDGNVTPIEVVAPAPAVAQPEMAATQPVEAPEKFVTDGQVDLVKVEKSTLHADEAIRKYQEKEAELRKLQNTVNQLQQTVQPQSMVNPNQLTPEKINEALARGNNPGQVLLELNALAYQTAKTEAMMEMQNQLNIMNAKVESQQRAKELEKIADKDPWVFSEEGLSKLYEMRQNKPWLNQAPEPWKEAYLSYKAEQEFQKPAPQVMPTPMAQTVKAPPTPVQAAARVPAQSVSLSRLSQDKQAIDQYLNSLSPEQQKDFWRQTIGATK